MLSSTYIYELLNYFSNVLCEDINRLSGKSIFGKQFF